MRMPVLGLSALALAAFASPAMAQDAPASEFTVSGGATVVSDYRFRGVSQTNKRFALQGTFTVAHSSGFYATVWGSSIDDYVAAGGDQEIDLIAGYAYTFPNGVKIDGGVLYYYYPGSGGVNSDFFEPYLSASGTVGPVSAKLSVAYAPKQHAIASAHSRDDNTYVAADLSYAVPNTGFAVSAHVGHTFGPSFLNPVSPAKDDYTDWGAGVSYTWDHLTLGVNYVDTDVTAFSSVPPASKSRNLTKGGVVVSLGVAF